MKKVHFRSLKVRTLFLLIILELVFAALIAYNNFSALSVIQKRVYRNTEDTLILYQKHLDESMSRSETYLYTLAIYDTAIQKILYDDPSTTKTTSTNWYSLLYQLQKNMQNNISTYTLDGTFCYLPDQDYCVMSTTINNAHKLRNIFTASIADECVNLIEWTLIQLDGEYFFSRILHVNGVYVGAWVRMDQLLDSLISIENINSSLYFATPGDTLLVNGEDPVTLSLKNKSGYTYTTLDDKEMLLVSLPLEKSPFILNMFIPTAEFRSADSTLINVILFVFFGFLLFWLLIVLSVNRWILKPVNNLSVAIKQLRSGNLDAHVAFIPHQPEEFLTTATAFNEMVSEIKELKIDVYERKLQKQRLEALYLKQQISPHFMINCLNTVYQLAQPNYLELARRMLKDFSRHLRYTLSSGQTVSLGEEIELVQNYVELSNIRYPDCIALHLTCPEALYSATAIPLLLLNFVENTIKYEVVMGQLLEIHISIEAFESDSEAMLRICIWDTGKGFSPDMLEQLQNLEYYIQNEEEHIGIVNVLLRARPVYAHSSFSFCNRTGAGAQIDMELSLLPYKTERSPKGESS